MLGAQLQGAFQPPSNHAEMPPIEYFSTLAGLHFFVQEETKALPRDIVLTQGFDQASRTSLITQTAEELRGRITGPVRLVQQIVRAWSLTNSELVNLLVYPSEGMVSALLDGRITFWPESDRGDRVRIMYFVHSTLADLFVNPADEARWMREPLEIFEEMSPLEFMLRKRIPGMLSVRAFVEQRLANH